MIHDRANDHESRLSVRTALEDHPVHNVPPVGDPYVLGRWHKHRASAKGYVKEALAKARSRLADSVPPAKLLVFGRPRSGTTLLGQLMGQVPDIHDDRECLHHAVLDPLKFLQNRARCCKAKGYVCKFLSYQMFEVQRIQDPLAFFEHLHDVHFHLLHLRRHTYDQALSLSTAQVTSQYFLDPSASYEKRLDIRIEPERFLAQVLWNLEMLSYEDQLMSNFPHLVVQYENDLLNPVAQQKTIDTICTDLGIRCGTVKATLQRTGGTNGKFRVTNEDELKLMLQKNDLDHILEERM
ncbi:hypothetical protein ACROSR_17015 [Roseovarius tibetensis]|uniref:hypothetical protein n=1 Tax=Roseovarius tibetensis TaxID=2685897 RepID=UPI003D7F7C9E